MKELIIDLFWILGLILTFVLFCSKQFQVEFFFHFCAVAFVIVCFGECGCCASVAKAQTGRASALTVC